MLAKYWLKLFFLFNLLLTWLNKNSKINFRNMRVRNFKYLNFYKVINNYLEAHKYLNFYKVINNYLDAHLSCWNVDALSQISLRRSGFNFMKKFMRICGADPSAAYACFNAELRSIC